MVFQESDDLRASWFADWLETRRREPFRAEEQVKFSYPYSVTIRGNLVTACFRLLLFFANNVLSSLLPRFFGNKYETEALHEAQLFIDFEMMPIGEDGHPVLSSYFPDAGPDGLTLIYARNWPPFVAVSPEYLAWVINHEAIHAVLFKIGRDLTAESIKVGNHHWPFANGLDDMLGINYENRE